MAGEIISGNFLYDAHKHYEVNNFSGTVEMPERLHFLGTHFKTCIFIPFGLVKVIFIVKTL
jgi:hypothetical protein